MRPNGVRRELKNGRMNWLSQGRTVDAETFAEIQTHFARLGLQRQSLDHDSREGTTPILAGSHTGDAGKLRCNESEEKDEIPTVILSTASPFKFADSVLHALWDDISWSKTEPLSLLTQLSNLTGWLIPPGLVDLTATTLKHRSKCRVDTMPEAVAGFIEK